MNAHESAHVDESLDELRRSLAGAVLVPDDADYDAARRGFNALIDRRPAVIVRCVRAGDVARVDVDGSARIARAEGGATWLDFDPATQAFGLVTPGGVVGSTGVCGLALGGGIGHLTAQHGLTCDNLVGAEVVTPDGAVIRATEDENAELLWGCAAEAATSMWQLAWSFVSTRSSGWSAGCLSTAGTESAMPCAASATSPHVLHVTSPARRAWRWTIRSCRL